MDNLMRKNLKPILSSSIGEIACVYDFTIYAFMAPVIGKLFFPKADPTTQIIYTFVIFFLGFIARPVGALIFGRLGDKKGRTKTLSLTILLMAIPSMITPLLPTYNTLGFLASVLLALMRIIQGLAVGGEFTGSMVYLSEHAIKSRKYLMSSLSWSSALFGTLVASITFSLIEHIVKLQQLYSWGWRLPFALSFIGIIVGIYIRKSCKEPSEYLDSLRNTKTKEHLASTWSLLKSSKKHIVKIAGINVQLAILSYFCIIFMPTLLTKFLKISKSFSSILSSLSILVIIILVPIFAKLCDKSTGKRILKISAASLALLSIPILLLLNSKEAFNIILAQFLLILCCAASMSAIPQLMVEITPIQNRYTLISFPYNIVYSILGGSVPLLISTMVQKFHFIFPVAAILIVTSIISFISCSITL